MDIFLDYARRLDLRDKDGEPLVKWSTPEECFEAWKECTRGRPCDYTGLSYEKLRGGSGIQWPCNDEAPDGTERLYHDLRFPTLPDLCEDYGHDLETGATFSAADFKAHGAEGRACSRQPHGRHRRNGPATSTRSRSRPAAPSTTSTRNQNRPRAELQAAAPDVWVELSERRQAARHRRRRPGARLLTTRLGRSTGTGCAISAKAPCSSRSITATGIWARRGPTAAPEPPTS